MPLPTYGRIRSNYKVLIFEAGTYQAAIDIFKQIYTTEIIYEVFLINIEK